MLASTSSASKMLLQMPKPTARHRVPPSVVTRLSRIEALLIEMRHEQDVQLKQSAEFQQQFEEFAEHVTTATLKIRRSRASTP